MCLYSKVSVVRLTDFQSNNSALEATKAIYYFANLTLRNTSFADDRDLLFIRIHFIRILKMKMVKKLRMS